jgi:hypothetical protein
MGIKLIVEVLDQYHGPHAHKLWLMAFAEVANDDTRAGWPRRQVLANRADVSVGRASNIASALVAEGVIKRDEVGRRGRGSTTYVLADLNGVRELRTPSEPNRVRSERTLLDDDDVPDW